MTRCFAIGLFALALSAVPATAQPVPEHTLRVLTWNVWDLPVVSTHREARVERIGPAIAALEPDVVALQEVWVDEDARIIGADLAAAGLVHQLHYTGEGRRSGLLVASRHPFEDRGFRAFTLGATSHVPWHLDWRADKGVAVIRVHTPVGPVDVANTHLQASYGGGYGSVRLGQMVEVARVLGQGTSGPPVILAGDLNTHNGELPRRWLRAQASLVEVAPDFGVDDILFRQGEGVRVQLRSQRRVMNEPVDVGGGELALLSDHDGLLAELSLSECEGCTAAVAPRGAAMVALVSEARAFARASLSDRRFEMWLSRGSIPLVLLVLLLAFVKRRRLRHAWLLSALLAVVGLSWLAHFAFHHGPASVAGHELLVAEIDEADG